MSRLTCSHPAIIHEKKRLLILENVGMMRESQILATVWPSAGILECLLYS